MARYRFYGIALGQQRASGRDFLCDNDEKALLLGQAMIGNFEACEIWAHERYVGVAMPPGVDATNVAYAAAHEAFFLVDGTGERRAIAERDIRDAIAYYQDRRGWLSRHERMKLHILRRDLFNLLQIDQAAPKVASAPDPGATVHYLWSLYSEALDAFSSKPVDHSKTS